MASDRRYRDQAWKLIQGIDAFEYTYGEWKKNWPVASASKLLWFSEVGMVDGERLLKKAYEASRVIQLEKFGFGPPIPLSEIDMNGRREGVSRVLEKHRGVNCFLDDDLRKEVLAEIL